MPPFHPSPQQRRRDWVGALRDFARAPAPASERCELCGTSLAAVHSHLIDPASQRLYCACAACIQPSDAYAPAGLLRLPDEVRALSDFHISDLEWDALMIPIGLAFFYRTDGAARVTAMYPGPAGTVRSPLDPHAWGALVERNPQLDALRPQVEALLIDRVNNARRYFIVPIDRCYALAGLLRQQWQGLSGGAAVWESIERFFDHLQSLVNHPHVTHPAPAHHHG
jgi:hypothetical protein